MKTLNHIFWIFLFAVAISACSKDSEPCDPNDEESPCYAGVSGSGKLLLAEEKNNGIVVRKYEYDNQNRMTVAYSYDTDGLYLTTTYSYSGGDFPKTVTLKSNSGKTAVQEYTFGKEGRPVSMVESSPGNRDDIPIDHTYSYSKNTIVQTSIAREKDPGIYVDTYTYDDKGNLLSIVYTLDGQWSMTVEQGNYDDKIAAGYYGNPMAWLFPGKNNFGTLKVTDKVLGVTADQVWKYTYNNAGYPITAKLYNNGSDAVVESSMFTYKPAK